MKCCFATLAAKEHCRYYFLLNIYIAEINALTLSWRRPVSCRANQGTGFYMLTASLMKELKEIRGVWKRQNILLHQLVQVKATSGEVHHYALSLLWRTSLLYRNQLINLLGKSMEKFLYDRDLRHKRVYKSVLIKLFHIWLQQTKRNIPMLFVRGDGVILISPSLRVGV